MMGNSSEEEGAGLPGAGQGEDPVFLRARLAEVEARYAQVHTPRSRSSSASSARGTTS